MNPWPMVKLGDVAQIISGLTFKKTEVKDQPDSTFNCGVIRATNFQNTSLNLNNLVYAPNSIVKQQKLLSQNDIALIASSGSLTTIGNVAFVDFNKQISFGAFLRVIRVKSDKIFAKFLFHFLSSNATQKRLKSLSQGANIKNLRQADLLNLKIPLPPLDEQRRIARVLNSSTSAINNSRHEIDLLHNLRNSQFIPSNTSEKVHLGELITIGSGQIDPTLPDQQNQIHVAPDSINSDYSTFNEIRTCAEDAVISGKYEFSAGDILYSKIRPYLNKVAIPSFDGVCSADMYVIKPKSGISAEYVRAVLMSPHFLAYANKESGRASIPKINRKALLSYRLPKPTQEDISVATARIREIDNAIAQMTSRMKLMEELHQSLATRALAGQL